MMTLLLKRHNNNDQQLCIKPNGFLVKFKTGVSVIKIYKNYFPFSCHLHIFRYIPFYKRLSFISQGFPYQQIRFPEFIDLNAKILQMRKSDEIQFNNI